MISYEDFRSRYESIWATIPQIEKGPHGLGPFLPEHATDGCPFGNANWRVALIPGSLSHSRIPVEEYDWDGNFDGLYNFLDPLIWTWKKRQITEIIFTQNRAPGRGTLWHNSTTNDPVPCLSGRCEASYQGLFDLRTAIHKSAEEEKSLLMPDLGFLLFDETGEWAYYEYSDGDMGVVGGTPAFMKDFFDLGGGEDMTRRRFYFHDIVFGLHLDYKIPRERARLEIIYDWAGWPHPDYPATEDDEPYNKIDDPYFDRNGNWISDEDPKTVTIPDPDTTTVIRKTD